MLRHLRQLASESLVYGLAGMITRFLSVFLVPVYTRIFTPADYGVLSLVLTTMTLVGIFVTLALDNSAHRWYWEHEDLEERKRTLASWTWCQIGVSSGFTLLITAFAGPLAFAVVGGYDAALYFILAAVSLPLGTPGVVLVNWLRMQRRPWATMIYTVATSVGNLALTIVLVVGLNQGLTGIFVAQVLTALGGSVAAIWLMRDWVSWRAFDWRRLWDMLHFAIPLIPAALAFWVVNLADRYFVQIFRSTNDVGLYAVGSSLAAVVAMVTGAFQQAWGPFAMSIHKQSDAKQVYATVLTLYVWLSCLVCTALTILAPEILRILATEAYAGAADVVAFLSFSYVVIGLSYIAAVGPAIAKTNTPTGIAVTLAALVNIGLNFVLVPWIGKNGAAIATLLSQSIVPLYVFYRAQQLYPIPYRFGITLIVLLFSALLMMVGLRVNTGSLAVDIALKLGLLLLFVPLPFVLRVVTPAQARAFWQRSQEPGKGISGVS